jgi:hypothetical protein
LSELSAGGLDQALTGRCGVTDEGHSDRLTN